MTQSYLYGYLPQTGQHSPAGTCPMLQATGRHSTACMERVVMTRYTSHVCYTEKKVDMTTEFGVLLHLMMSQ